MEIITSYDQGMPLALMSRAQKVAMLTPAARSTFFKQSATDLGMSLIDFQQFMESSWRFIARPKQLAPEGNWATWVIRAGRGFGKTRSGAGWVQERAVARKAKPRWIALIARTPADARDYMIEGPGGILRNAPKHERPDYEPSKRRLTWPDGSWATIFSDEEPDQLRGFSGDTAWLDEFAKFKNAKAVWDNLQFGMREASQLVDADGAVVGTDRPRRLITTTPRPIPILREIEKLSSTTVVHGTSYENKANLDEDWFRETIGQYEGTRLGRQEVMAEILDDLPGALWNRDEIDDMRIAVDRTTNKPVDYDLPDMQRVVVAIDPSGTRGDEDEGDDIGIIVAGKGVDGMGYVLADYTCKLGPDGWGRRAVDAYRRWNADCIVAERNFGGAMVEHTIRTVATSVPYREVHASRGKVIRAQPISALYSQGKVCHVGNFPLLEDQMCLMSDDGYMGEGSPDRLDALVWALSDLMIRKKPKLKTVSGKVKGLS